MHESTETENKNKSGESEEVQRDLSHELLDWLQEENLVDESTSTEPWETQSTKVKTLPVLLMNYLWSREQKWFPERPELRYLLEDENNQGFFQKTWYSRAPSGKIW